MLDLLPLRPRLPSLHRQPFLSAGAGGTSPHPCRGIRPRFVVVPLPVLVAHVPLPDPRGRPRLPLVLLPPSTAPVDVDAITLDAAGVTLGCVGGARECPGAVASLFSAVREFPVATDKAPPGSVCSLPPGSPSNARVAPSGGVTPTAKEIVFPCQARPFPRAPHRRRGGAGLTQRGGQGSRHRDIPVFGHEGVLHGYISVVSWRRLPPYLRVNFRRRGCSFRLCYSRC